MNAANVSIAIPTATLLRTIVESLSFGRGFDKRLRECTQTTIGCLRADYAIIRYGEGRGKVIYCDFRDSEESKTEQIFREVDEYFQKSIGPIDQVSGIEVNIGGYLVVGLLVSCRAEQTDNPFSVDETPKNRYVFFGFRPEYPHHTSKEIAVVLDHAKNTSWRENLSVIARALNQSFVVRNRVYSRFPSRFSRLYWAAARTRRADGDLPPPWDRRIDKTVTLSFDLRRSTRAMELASGQQDFANWLEAMTIILRQIARDNFGIFDKFTGDGALIHFLPDECVTVDELTDRAAIDTSRFQWRVDSDKIARDAVAVYAAVKCGWEMIHAIEHHSQRLSEILRLGVPAFGPAVGIAIDDALWSVDREGNPILVGNGVVQACRITDKTPRGKLQIARDAEKLFEATYQGGVTVSEVRFSSKERDESEELMVSQQEHAPVNLARPEREIHGLVEDIRKYVDRRLSGTAQ